MQLKDRVGSAATILVSTVLLCISIAAWLQHIYTCFTMNKWGFLIAGALCFPIAIAHGIGIWLGFW